MSNTHAATPGLNPSSLLAAHAGGTQPSFLKHASVALASPSPKLLSYHLLHRVEFFGDHQTPNVTAPATRGRTRTASPNAQPSLFVEVFDSRDMNRPRRPFSPSPSLSADPRQVQAQELDTNNLSIHSSNPPL